MEPPILSQYSDSPIYEISAMLTLVHVRPQALWYWSQSLGISGDPRSDLSGQRQRYSERDLVALLWMREMVVAGETPQDAAVRLLNAQRGVSGSGYSHSGALGSGALVSGALGSGALGMEPPNWGTGNGASGPLGSPLGGGSGGLYPSVSNGSSAPTYEPQQFNFADDLRTATQATTQATTGAPGRVSYPNLSMSSGAGMGSAGATPTQPGHGAPDLWRAEREWSSGVRNSTAELRSAGLSGLSGPLRADLPTPSQPLQQGGFSGRLGAAYGAALEPPTYSGRSGVPSQSLSSLRELRPLMQQLLQAFARFDTARAQAILSEALRNQGVDNVCVGLVQPTVARISELWSKCEVTNPEERFALNFLRGFMFSVFNSTHEPLGAPLAVVGCAPNETSDFGALLLAVLWRRAGLRIAYLGRGIDGDQLLHEPRWPVTPSVFALTATTSQRIRALARIGKKVSELPAPTPLFAYWGPIFVRNPDLKRKVNGFYLGDDATTATQSVRRLLNMEGFGE